MAKNGHKKSILAIACRKKSDFVKKMWENVNLFKKLRGKCKFHQRAPVKTQTSSKGHKKGNFFKKPLKKREFVQMVMKKFKLHIKECKFCQKFPLKIKRLRNAFDMTSQCLRSSNAV